MQALTTYDYVRDLGGPVMYLIQNIILAVTAYYALSSIKEDKRNSATQIKHQEAIARKRATLDLIINMTADVEYNQARAVVVRMKNESINPAHLHERMSQRNNNDDDRKLARTQYMACQRVLNKFALFANGIQTEVLDENLFKSYYYSTYVTIIAFLRGYIIEVRNYASAQVAKTDKVSNDTIYQELIWLRDRWSATPLAKHGNGSV